MRSRIAAIPGVRPAARLVRGAARRLGIGRPQPATHVFDDAPATPEIRRDIASLKRANRRSRRPLTDPASPVVVTTTTHGTRLKSAYIAIESVARGTLQPRRHILYLDDPALAANPPRSIRRLMRRGLEVIEVPAGKRVHTKHYFYVTSTDHHELPLATHEDDIVFPPDWLERMVAAHQQHPDDLITPRAHRVVVEDGAIAPYTHWVPATTAEPRFAHFGTTVSGQLYPPAFLDFVHGAGDGFLQSCPNNDDVWLHHLAVTSGRKVRQLTATPEHFPFVPGTQDNGLYLVNIVEGANDRQIAATYTAHDIAVLSDEASREFA